MCIMKQLHMHFKYLCTKLIVLIVFFYKLIYLFYTYMKAGTNSSLSSADSLPTCPQ